MTPIFLIAGAPAAGKTTISCALARSFGRCLHIPVDTMREMVVSGVKHPDVQWSQELIEQLTLVRACVSAMAHRYRNAGFAVAVDDFYDPYSQLAEYNELLATQQTYKILLYPSEQTAMARNLGRYGPGRKTDNLAVGIRIVYDHLQTAVVDGLKEQGWIVVDSTEQSVEQTVAEILARTGANQ